MWNCRIRQTAHSKLMRRLLRPPRNAFEAQVAHTPALCNHNRPQLHLQRTISGKDTHAENPDLYRRLWPCSSLNDSSWPCGGRRCLGAKGVSTLFCLSYNYRPGKSRSRPWGVVGRPAGTVEAFRYSAAMKSSGLVWDEATLDRFLAAPRNVVAKTTMTVSVTKPEDRQNIIAYLKSLAQ